MCLCNFKWLCTAVLDICLVCVRVYVCVCMCVCVHACCVCVSDISMLVIVNSSQIYQSHCCNYPLLSKENVKVFKK